MTTTREYRSTDPGAPVLDGTVGSGTAWIKAILYGTSGVAYGTGADEKAAAGWSQPYTGTNKVVLRNSLAAGGTGYHFRFDDNGIGTGGAREMMIRAYSAMSDVDTGSDIMPLTAIFANGGPIRKSATLSSTARPWMVWADELTCYFWIQCNTTGFVFGGFGDFASDVPGDNFRAFVVHGWRENNDGASGIGGFGALNLASPTSADRRGMFLAKGYGLTGDPVSFSCPTLANSLPAAQAIGSTFSVTGGSASPLADPGAGSGQRFYFPALIGAEGIMRGRLRGLYLTLNNLSAVTDGSYEIAPAGIPVGSKLAIARYNAGSAIGAVAVETGLAW